MLTEAIHHYPIIIVNSPRLLVKAQISTFLVNGHDTDELSQSTKADYWYQNYLGDLLKIDSWDLPHFFQTGISRNMCQNPGSSYANQTLGSPSQGDLRDDKRVCKFTKPSPLQKKTKNKCFIICSVSGCPNFQPSSHMLKRTYIQYLSVFMNTLIPLIKSGCKLLQKQ